MLSQTPRYFYFNYRVGRFGVFFFFFLLEFYSSNFT